MDFLSFPKRAFDLTISMNCYSDSAREECREIRLKPACIRIPPAWAPGESRALLYYIETETSDFV